MTNYLAVTLIQSLIETGMIVLGGFAVRAVRPSEGGWMLGGVTGMASGAVLAAWLSPYLHVITGG